MVHHEITVVYLSTGSAIKVGSQDDIVLAVFSMEAAVQPPQFRMAELQKWHSSTTPKSPKNSETWFEQCFVNGGVHPQKWP